MKNKKKKTTQKTKHNSTSGDKNLARTSYYSHGYSYDQQTEIGIQGAYGSQGQKDSDNSYTR